MRTVELRGSSPCRRALWNGGSGARQENGRQPPASSVILRGIHMQRRDGTLGMPEAAPFDRIIVTAGGPEVPRPLTDQLDEGGILLIPVGPRPRAQRLMLLRKERGYKLFDGKSAGAKRFSKMYRRRVEMP